MTSPEDYLSHLPLELQYNALVKLDIASIIKYCETSTQAAGVCCDPYFWEKKLDSFQVGNIDPRKYFEVRNGEALPNPNIQEQCMIFEDIINTDNELLYMIQNNNIPGLTWLINYYIIGLFNINKIFRRFLLYPRSYGRSYNISGEIYIVFCQYHIAYPYGIIDDQGNFRIHTGVGRGRPTVCDDYSIRDLIDIMWILQIPILLNSAPGVMMINQIYIRLKIPLSELELWSQDRLEFYYTFTTYAARNLCNIIHQYMQEHNLIRIEEDDLGG